MSGQIFNGADISADVAETCDVCIIGSGAGGGMLAEGLTQAGLNVVMLEAGGHHTREDFDLQEGTAYPMLYQDRGTRATADVAITVLQGRAVGGSTTVNWTTCFRTPQRILDHWQRVHGIEGLDAETLAPHFEAAEKRLNISEWPEGAANPNNQKIFKGARALGYDVGPLRRNVKGCANSGYCGVGCPVDGKQSQLITTIPSAVSMGMRLYADTQAERLEVDGDRVVAVHGAVLDRHTGRPTGRAVVVRPKLVALCGGAINSPGVLLKSELDFNGRVGKRTFIHPVIAVPGMYDSAINPFWGAPQSAGSHHFIDRGADKLGYFIEAAPMHPVLAATASAGFGKGNAAFLQKLSRLGVMLSLGVDGLMPGDDGGEIILRKDGRVVLDYPLTNAHREYFQHAHKTLARMTLAAGATMVATLHQESILIDSEAALSKLDDAKYGAFEHGIFTAHQMGGCAMGPDPSTSVVDSNHQHHHIPNLFVVDGSVLPTALGVNPSETVYGLANRAVGLVAGAV